MIFVKICSIKELDFLSGVFLGGVRIPLVDVDPYPFLDFLVRVTVVDEGLGYMFKFCVSEGPC